MGDTTPKTELLLRFEQIIAGLRDQGVDPGPLVDVVRGLRARVPRSATIQEVSIRALEAVVKHEATLDGRLVDALVSVARTYGVVLTMHPALLLVAALGGQDNPDRDDPRKSAILDSLLSTVLEDHADYQESLYSLAVLARNTGLDATADAAVKLLRQIADKDKPAEQGSAVELQVRAPEPRAGDNLAWVMKAILTLTTLTVLAANAAKVSGAVRDLIDSLDVLFGGGD